MDTAAMRGPSERVATALGLEGASKNKGDAKQNGEEVRRVHFPNEMTTSCHV